ELVDFDDGRAHQRAIHASEALESWTTGRAMWIGRHHGGGIPAWCALSELRREFGVTSLEEPYERAAVERSAYSLDLRKLAAAPENLQEACRLPARSPERPPLVEDDSPGVH